MKLGILTIKYPQYELRIGLFIMFFQYLLPVLVCSLLLLVIAEFIIYMVCDSVWEILLLDVMVGEVMRIEIMLSNDLCTLAVKVNVLQVTRKIKSVAAVQVIKCRVYSHAGAV